MSSMSRQTLISTCNDSLNTLLGGGFVASTLNIFERSGTQSQRLDSIITKTISASTLVKQRDLVYVNFNDLLPVTSDHLIASFPLPVKVKTEVLNKDVRPDTRKEQIKIAWRYSNNNILFRDERQDQLDFGHSLKHHHESLGKIIVVNLDKIFTNGDMRTFLEILEAVKTSDCIDFVMADITHPHSVLDGHHELFLTILYALRAFARTLKQGAVFMCINTDSIDDYNFKQDQIYNLADSVVHLSSLSEEESILIGCVHSEGLVEYRKVPKLYSNSYHFKRPLSDWAYRTTSNNKYFLIDQLSLPPMLTNDQTGQTSSCSAR